MEGTVQVTCTGDLDTILAFLRTAPRRFDVVAPLPIGVELRLYLERKGVTNAEFASWLGVHKSTIGHIIKQQTRRPRRDLDAAIRRYIKENP